MKRFTNSSRGVISIPIVSGERPIEANPFQDGTNSSQGTTLPWRRSRWSLPASVEVLSG